jgi:DNA-directed RNA polymerase specialized sigma24 family protein
MTILMLHSWNVKIFETRRFASETPGPVRDRLLRLHEAVELAETNRRSYLTELRLNGYTLRQLSDVLGIAPSTVMRWAPIESDGQSPSLDDPVEATHEEKAA